jgi:hypothetical protein
MNKARRLAMVSWIWLTLATVSLFRDVPSITGDCLVISMVFLVGSVLATSTDHRNPRENT